ncbi:MAG: TraB/GumN family protein [Bdellovibrionota bacterium]
MLSQQNIFQLKRLFKALSLGIALSMTLTLAACSSGKGDSGYSGTLQNPYFYSITSNEGKTSYMLGTIHIGVGISELPSYIMDAFRNTDYHFSEISEVYQPMHASYLVAQSMYNKEKFESTFARYRYQVKNQGPDLTADQIRRAIYIGIPPYVANVLGQKAACEFLWYGEILYKQPVPFLDYELAAVSVAHKKKTFGLENDRVRDEADRYARSRGQRDDSDECDIGTYLTSDSVAAEVKAFINTKPLSTMISTYRSGAAFKKDSDEDYSLQYRNKSWIPVMKPYLKKGRAFFSFGAGHLEGYHGIIQHLERAGFTVVRHNSAAPLRVENPTLAFEQTLIQKYESSTSDDSTQNKFIIKPLMPKFGSL